MMHVNSFCYTQKNDTNRDNKNKEVGLKNHKN